MKYSIKLIILFLLTNTYISSNGFEDQAKIHFSIAKEYFKDGNYQASIRSIKDFLVLYPKSKLEIDAMKILKDSYLKTENFKNAIEINLEIYKKYTVQDIGILAYIEALNLYKKIGDFEKYKQMVDFIKNQVFTEYILTKIDAN